MNNLKNLILLIAILAVGCSGEPVKHNGNSNTAPVISQVNRPPSNHIKATQTVSPDNINEILTIPPSPKGEQSQDVNTSITNAQMAAKTEKPKPIEGPNRDVIKTNLQEKYGNVEVEDVKIVKPDVDPAFAGLTDDDRIRMLNSDVRKQLGKVLEFSTQQYKNGRLASRLSKTSSGIEYMMVKDGPGLQAIDNSYVAIKYMASNMDGEIYEENMSKNENRRIKLDKGQAIPGLEEVIKTMRQGGNAIFFIPPNLALGDRGRLGVSPNSKVVYMIYLTEVN